MKPAPPHLVSTSGRISLFVRLGLACLVVVSALTPAHAANTFVNTGPLATGRTAHTATLLHNGKVLVVGGGNTNYLASAELYDPATGAWSAAGSLATARLDHTATLLPNGKVLVVGGSDTGFIFASAELYDPATGTWSVTGSLATARAVHTATLLANGKVLVAGGTSGSGTLASAELYDPGTGTWSATGNLATPRFLHSATLLPSGKVLVAGGLNGGTYLATAQLYDPGTGSWTATGSFTTGRYSHTATLLTSGKVLLAGGTGSSGNLDTAHLYDPAGNGGVGSWTATGNLATARADHTASLLPNGKVLVAGGAGSSAELFDPAGNAGAGSWSATGALVAERADHTATLLPGGQMLVVGGKLGTTYHASAELYDSAVATWSATGALATGRDRHTATLLPNGKVLVAGGRRDNNPFDYNPLNSAELYDPATGAWSVTGNLGSARYDHTATLLPNGKVLVTGGILVPPPPTFVGGVYLASTELYDPATGTWAASGSLGAARSEHSATLLPDGRVLIVGGYDGSIPAYHLTADLYDPGSGIWSPTASVNPMDSRSRHTATLLPNGKVLIVGGIGFFASGLFSSARIYDPPAGTWSNTGSLPEGRTDHSATLLPNGKALVAGGSEGSSGTSAMLYDLMTGSWAASGSLGSIHTDHSTTLLPDGRVLVAGGVSSTSASVELYDPAKGTWSTTVSLGFTRADHTATVLLNGKVLVAAGHGSATSRASAELYDFGQGFSAAWQPQISSASFDASGKLVLIGTGFRGIWNSPTDFPFVQLRQLENEQSVFLLPDPAAPFSATAFASVPVAPFSGYAQVTVFAKGIPSAASVVFFPTPDIGVFQPVATGIADGGTKSFGTMFVGSPPVSLTFTIKNPGTDTLTGLTITKDGTNAADFTVLASPTVPVLTGGSTTFTIQFASATSGTKTAAIHIANNANSVGKNPYDINLTGEAYSFTTDTDGDGLNDASEYQLATLGFDWQVSQTNLVNTLSSNLNGTGLIQALNVGTPLLAKDPTNGLFTLTIGVQKATNLVDFLPFPMTAPQTLINGEGKLEFQFPAPDNAAFFRLEAH